MKIKDEMRISKSFVLALMFILIVSAPMIFGILVREEILEEITLWFYSILGYSYLAGVVALIGGPLVLASISIFVFMLTFIVKSKRK